MPQRVGHVSVPSQGSECSELTRSVMAVPPPRYNQTPSTTQMAVVFSARDSVYNNQSLI
jgi:hypothetical protein